MLMRTNLTAFLTLSETTPGPMPLLKEVEDSEGLIEFDEAKPESEEVATFSDWYLASSAQGV